jgi:hypothetical protein
MNHARMNGRIMREQRDFIEIHKDAHMIICDTSSGYVMEAHYFSPMKAMQEAQREYMQRFFQLVREEEAKREGEL